MSEAHGEGEGNVARSARTVVVRPPRPADIARLWEMVLALAAYERLEHQVSGSADRLARDLFDAAPRVHGLVAEADGDLVGYALFYPTYSSFRTAPALWLEDIYVEPRVRGLGVGRRLLGAVASFALARGCGRLGWIVLV